MNRNVRIAKQLVRLAKSLLINVDIPDITMAFDVFKVVNGNEESSPSKKIKYTITRNLIEEYVDDSTEFKALQDRNNRNWVVKPTDFLYFLFDCGWKGEKTADELFQKTGLLNGHKCVRAYEIMEKSFFIDGNGMKMLDSESKEVLAMIRCTNLAFVLEKVEDNIYEYLFAKRDSANLSNQRIKDEEQVDFKVSEIYDNLRGFPSSAGEFGFSELKPDYNKDSFKYVGANAKHLVAVSYKLLPKEASKAGNEDGSFVFKFRVELTGDRNFIYVYVESGFAALESNQRDLIGADNAKKEKAVKKFMANDCGIYDVRSFVKDEYEKAGKRFQACADMLKNKYGYIKSDYRDF